MDNQQTPADIVLQNQSLMITQLQLENVRLQQEIERLTKEIDKLKEGEVE